MSASPSAPQGPTPRLAVVLLSDSFLALWEPLARDTGFAPPCTTSLAANAGAADVVIVAAGGVEDRAPERVRELVTRGSRAAIAVVGALDERRLAAAALAAGAAEYFALPEEREALRAWLGARAAERRTEADGDAVANVAGYDFSALVGRSEALHAAVRRAARVVPHRDAPVLVTGETGTGKQLLAEAIHRNGPRGTGPFVEVNCAALPGTLLEAELFGYEKGAFTDARAAKAGLFELADGGTLFLDEIGDLPLVLQGKLLSALERRRVRRLGGTREHPVDVRVVAATHVELGAAVREGRFRADLFFRLDVVRVHLPPLRERGDDAALLADHFGRALGRRHGVRWLPLDAGDRAAVLAHRWPGNVRELRNVVERALLCGEPLALQLAATSAEADAPPPVAALAAPSSPRPPGPPQSLRELEREAAFAMVARCGGNKSRAALALGVSRKRLYALLAERAEAERGEAERAEGDAALTPAGAAP